VPTRDVTYPYDRHVDIAMLIIGVLGLIAAADWIVTIESSRGRFIPMDKGVEGWSDRQAPPGWTTRWLWGGPNDSIGPGLHREFPVAPSSDPPQRVSGRYVIKASRMKARSGKIEVSIDDDRNQSTIVT
jgi:hypothetical protein